MTVGWGFQHAPASGRPVFLLASRRRFRRARLLAPSRFAELLPSAITPGLKPPAYRCGSQPALLPVPLEGSPDPFAQAHLGRIPELGARTRDVERAALREEVNAP